MAKDKIFTKLMIDTAKGRTEKFSIAESNEAIRKHFFEVLGLNEDSSLKEIRRALRKNKVEVFEIIEDVIEERLITGWGDNPFFRELVEVRNLADGDRNEFITEDTTILTVTEFSGNHHDLVRQKLGMGTSYSIKTSWYGIKVYEEFERFLAGRVDWAKYIEKLYEALDKKVNDALYQSFVGLGSQVPAAYAFAGSITEDEILQKAEMVAAATGKEVMICGPRAALSKIAALTNASLWSNNMKEERNTLGQLGVWNDIKMVRIPQVFTQGTRNFAYPENQFYILPIVDNKPIKLVYEGEGQYYETTDGATNRDMTIEAEYLTKLGIATVFGYDFAVGTFA